MRVILTILMISAIGGLNAQTWKLVWHDEFENPGLPDSSLWSYEEGFVRNNESQYYTSERLKNARIEDGCLIIEAHKENFREAEYTSASIHTKGKADFTYGKVEVSAKLPTGRGSWPAIWLLGSSYPENPWPLCGEIDIMEHVGYNPGMIYFNVHTEKYNWSNNTQKNDSIQISDFQNKFHRYSMIWTPDHIKFFVDDAETMLFENDDTGKAAWPFDDPAYLIVNLAIGGAWGGKYGIDDSIFPARYYIDYVRIYAPED